MHTDIVETAISAKLVL